MLNNILNKVEIYGLFGKLAGWYFGGANTWSVFLKWKQVND